MLWWVAGLSCGTVRCDGRPVQDDELRARDSALAAAEEEARRATMAAAAAESSLKAAVVRSYRW